MSRPFNKESFDTKWIEDPVTGCWEWQATKNQDGYGRVKRMGKLESAHRVSYELYVGDIGNKQVLHRCDNPSCINPAHLFLGTIQDNNKDKTNKGRAKANRMPGETHPSSKLSNEQVIQIYEWGRTMPSKWVAEWCDVSVGLINDIRAGRRWRHLIDKYESSSP